MSEQLTEQVSVRLTASLRSRVKRQAERYGVTERDIVRWALATAVRSDDSASRILGPIVQAVKEKEGQQ